MKTRSKKKAKKPTRRANSTRPRRQDPIGGPRSSAPSSLSRQALSQGSRIVRDTGNPADTVAGDLTGIPQSRISSTENVHDLVSEGQDREAEMIEAIENAPDPDQADIKIRPTPPNKIHSYKDRKRI